jgi:hypothetical protein
MAQIFPLLELITFRWTNDILDSLVSMAIRREELWAKFSTVPIREISREIDRSAP